jgi:hypothetical protein
MIQRFTRPENRLNDRSILVRDFDGAGEKYCGG